MSVSVSAYSLFTVSVLRRKIASGAPGGGAVGYSWSWGPLLRHRVAVKCQLEIAVFLVSKPYGLGFRAYGLWFRV